MNNHLRAKRCGTKQFETKFSDATRGKSLHKIHLSISIVHEKWSWLKRQEICDFNRFMTVDFLYMFVLCTASKVECKATLTTFGENWILISYWGLHCTQHLHHWCLFNWFKIGPDFWTKDFWVTIHITRSKKIDPQKLGLSQFSTNFR